MKGGYTNTAYAMRECSDGVAKTLRLLCSQFQVQLQANVPQPDLENSNNHLGEDDIDAALTDLQVSLEGNNISSPGDITHIPELSEYLRFFK